MFFFIYSKTFEFEKKNGFYMLILNLLNLLNQIFKKTMYCTRGTIIKSITS